MSSVSSIASTATALSNFKAQSAISTAVAGKQLDAIKQQGAAAVELIDAAATVGKSQHTGKVLDVRA